MRYYISDNHFFHERIDIMDGRGFDNLHEMHEYMIHQWNQKVTNNDEVFVLGDLSFGKGIQTWNIINRLNGKIYLVEGNHDNFYLDDPDFVDNFEDVISYGEYEDGNRKVIVCHYPIPFYNKQFSRLNDRSFMTYMLYGHLHNTYDEYLLHQSIRLCESQPRLNARGYEETTPFNMINTFCVFSDYVPLSLYEWILVDERRRKMIDDKEKEVGGRLNYQQWEELGMEIIGRAKNRWK